VITLKIEQANVIRKALRKHLEYLHKREAKLNPGDKQAHHDNQKEYDLVTQALSFL
jgi:hypothetical protein